MAVTAKNTASEYTKRIVKKHGTRLSGPTETTKNLDGEKRGQEWGAFNVPGKNGTRKWAGWLPMKEIKVSK